MVDSVLFGPFTTGRLKGLFIDVFLDTALNANDLFAIYLLLWVETSVDSMVC